MSSSAAASATDHTAQETNRMSMMPKLYVEDPRHEMQPTYLSDAEYERTMRSFIIVCTDVLIVNTALRTIALARRATLPMRGLWWIGGRRFAGERAEASVRRCFLRETKLDFSEERFRFLCTTEYRWANRAQEPSDAGSHNLAYTFTVELDANERARAAAHLDPREYDTAHGLRNFMRAELVTERVHPVILDCYDAVFPRTP